VLKGEKNRTGILKEMESSLLTAAGGLVVGMIIPFPIPLSMQEGK
jgi:hypothetical protein